MRRSFEHSFKITQQGATLNQKLNLVIEGHSFMAPGAPMSYYSQYSLSYDTVYNSSVSGSQMSSINVRASIVDSKIKSGYKNVLLLWIGTNDALITAGNGTAVYNSMKTYIQNRITAGFDVFAFTCCPNASAGAQFEIERDIFNGLMRTDLSAVVGAYILDTDTISTLDDSTNTLYYSDGLHLNSFGALQAIPLVKSAFTAKYNKYVNLPATVFDSTLTETKSGTGAAFQRLDISVSEVIELKLLGSAKFYANSTGTAGETDTWTLIPSGAGFYSFWVKVTDGTATLSISKKSAIIKLLIVNSTNAPICGGDISQFSIMTHVNSDGPNTLSGSITRLPLIDLLIFGTNTITGDLTGKTNLTRVWVGGSNTIFGEIGGTGTAAIVNGTAYFSLAPCRRLTYTAGALWSNTTVTINPSATYGMSSTEIDNILIDMAASPTLISKTITLKGANAARTAASDAAVATLTGPGRTNILALN